MALKGSSNLLAQAACNSLETLAYRLTFLSLKVWEIQDLQTGISSVCDIFLMCVYHCL